MIITVNEKNDVQLEKVYIGIVLKTDHQETMSICMRDTGFEFNYQGQWYYAQNGNIEKIEKRKSKYKYVKMTKKNKGALARIYGDAANDSTATFQIGNK